MPNSNTLRLLVTLSMTFGLNSIATAAPRPISFNRDIKPILSGKCFACHGPDDKERKADLRFDLSDPAHASGAFTPGKASESEIIKRLTSTDPEVRMPPPASKKPAATEAEIAIIRRWVDEGAKYDAHWAFVPPVKHAPPEAKNAAWSQSPIDRFIAAAHEEQGLQASPAADRRTLLRRLSFDLIGLPPTPEEVAAFEKDQSPEAYERQVDRLLASKHFGERLAMHWLDIVRYADSAGYHSDNPRNVTPYRDYVIRSFNNNLPFDQFVREQLAGDLLPDATLWQKVASGYNRLLQTTEEGGAQGKEYEAKYAADRVRNFGSTFMALTTGCAECHNHKFDPITAKDFYSLEAFFADIQEAAVGRREPGIPVASEEQTKTLAELAAMINAAQQELQTAAEKLTQAGDVAGPETKWALAKITSARTTGGLGFKALDDGSYKLEGNAPAQDTYEFAIAVEPGNISGVQIEALADDSFPANGPGVSPNGNYVLTEVKLQLIAADGKDLAVKLEKAVADHSQQNFAVAASIDGKADTGWASLPETGKSHEAAYQLAKPLEVKQGEQLKLSLAFTSIYPQHLIGRVRVSTTSDAGPVDRWVSPQIRTIASVPAAERTAEQKDKLSAFYRERSPALQPLREKVAQATAAHKQFDEAIPKSLISMTGANRVVRILPRGNWLDESGEIVTPQTPVSLGVLPASDKKPTRLDLANWLLREDHPLTSRVFVNRLWKLMFGRGITKSAEDFGMQGEYPIHPELLDYLAVDFRESGWDVKRLVKSLVMSQTYRQSSLASAEAREKDPANIWLARGSRYRLDAELVRDNALAVSGLLATKIGGPSVFPYQPPGYWSYLNFPGREWQNDKGEGLYRRGLYTWWQRTFPHPSLIAFDAPSREECVVDRPKSNTPLQALVLLNDPTYVEAARSLAERTVASSPENGARLEFLFRQALQRSPRDAEVKTLLALYEKHLAEFSGDAKSAGELLTVGDKKSAENLPPAELAAWTSVARVVLNLHESVTRN